MCRSGAGQPGPVARDPYLWAMRLLAPLLVLLFALPCRGQSDPREPRLVQFSGVVVTDSLVPIPFTHILVKNSYRGTMSDVYGYFSFVAQETDTILFSAVGFQRSQYAIPDSLRDSKYSMIHVLDRDTVQLKEFKVYPWPSREQFREAFLALRLPSDDHQLAMRKLSSAEMMERMENLPPDAYQSFQYQMDLDHTRLYYSGGTPNINLFNPIAWAQFIQAWQNGAFKKKE